LQHLVARMSKPSLVWWFGLEAEPKPSFVTSGLADMRVPEGLLHCVLFIGIKDGKGRFLPKATGFMAAIDDFDHQWAYLITAEHVVSGLQAKGHKIWIRTNLKNGGAEEVPIPAEVWLHSPTEDGNPITDVAVCPIQFSPEDEVIGIGLNGPTSIAASSDVLKSQDLGVGDEVAILGLFRSHHGQERNIPIVRIGNIAMIQGEPVYTQYCGYTAAHLIEARSISGLSGSPVFISTPPTRIIDGKTRMSTGQQFYLFGLIHGHFDVENLNEDIVVDDYADVPRGINTGIGIVVPVEQIIKTVFQPDLIEMRRNVVKERAKKHGAIADLGDDAGHPASDENPTHLEDFRRLVDVAARKRPQGDQT
jgi:hypothetical protein